MAAIFAARVAWKSGAGGSLPLTDTRPIIVLRVAVQPALSIRGRLRGLNGLSQCIQGVFEHAQQRLRTGEDDKTEACAVMRRIANGLIVWCGAVSALGGAESEDEASPAVALVRKG